MVEFFCACELIRNTLVLNSKKSAHLLWNHPEPDISYAPFWASARAVEPFVDHFFLLSFLVILFV